MDILEDTLKKFIWSDVDKVIFYSILENDNVYLVGPTGSGKSTRVKLMNYVYNKKNKQDNKNWKPVPFYRISLRETIEEDQLIGRLSLKVVDGSTTTEFVNGLITEAMLKGGWVLLDEIDAAKPETLFSLHSVFEYPREITIPELNNKKIEAHPEFRVICTGNTSGRGDYSGFYQGTKILNEAFSDRFIHFPIDYPSEKEEIDYLNNFCRRDLAKKIVKLASIFRKAAKNGKINFTFSIRRTSMIAKKIESWGIERTMKYLVLGKLDEDEMVEVCEAINQVFDVDLLKEYNAL